LIPDTAIDKETCDDPVQYSEESELFFVNGEAVVIGRIFDPGPAGQILRKERAAKTAARAGCLNSAKGWGATNLRYLKESAISFPSQRLNNL
jgi:hypothetical protein